MMRLLLISLLVAMAMGSDDCNGISNLKRGDQGYAKGGQFSISDPVQLTKLNDCAESIECLNDLFFGDDPDFPVTCETSNGYANDEQEPSIDIYCPEDSTFWSFRGCSLACDGSALEATDGYTGDFGAFTECRGQTCFENRIEALECADNYVESHSDGVTVTCVDGQAIFNNCEPVAACSMTNFPFAGYSLTNTTEIANCENSECVYGQWTSGFIGGGCDSGYEADSTGIINLSCQGGVATMSGCIAIVTQDDPVDSAAFMYVNAILAVVFVVFAY